MLESEQVFIYNHTVNWNGLFFKSKKIMAILKTIQSSNQIYSLDIFR